MVQFDVAIIKKDIQILERLRKKKVVQNTSLFSELDAKAAYAKMSG